MGLAIELGQRGISVAVVERHPEPQPIPKGQNLTQRTAEHFHFWGCEPELRAARTVPGDYGIGGMTAYGTLLSGYYNDWLPRELVRPFYFTDNERLPQYATEKVLRDRAAVLPSVELVYGWRAVDVTQDADGAIVDIEERKGLGKRRLRGRFVVGCDGANSVVRESTGMTQTRTDHDKLMVLLVFRSTGLHELLKRFPGKSFYNVLHPDLKGYWRFFGRVDLGETWFFHAPVPAGTTKENFDFNGLLYDSVGAEFDVAYDHIGFWDLRIAIADTYRNGSVFIAGDAAHSHPPYGGYGINTGFEDARNLGWKLAAVLEGWGGDALLDSYDAERRPVFASTARDFIESAIIDDRDFLEAYYPPKDAGSFQAALDARAAGSKSEVLAFEPNYAGSPVVFGPETAVCSAKGQHCYEARPGHHLAPRALSSGGNVFEALGRGFSLLAFGAPAQAVAAFELAAHAMDVPLTVIADTAADGREDYAAALVLVRPDQFVAWAGEAASLDAAAVLKRALAR
ncbi:monooxygenase [Breoghania sp. L-A4]|nr:FAD-dependent monooxygenase [Breoghania sp. L-A4]AXS42733.1 monooxygenase [Breoghania sp. L-A4]